MRSPQRLIASLGISKLGDDEGPRQPWSARMAAYRRIQSSAASREMEYFCSMGAGTEGCGSFGSHTIQAGLKWAKRRDLTSISPALHRFEGGARMDPPPLKREAPLVSARQFQILSPAPCASKDDRVWLAVDNDVDANDKWLASLVCCQTQMRIVR